jgi:hypothetical protein
VCKGQAERGAGSGRTPGVAGGAGFTDPTPWNRPNGSGARGGPLPSPVQTFLDDMCAKGRCPDPAPFANAGRKPNLSNAERRSAAAAGTKPAWAKTWKPPQSTASFKPNGDRPRARLPGQTYPIKSLPSVRRHSFGRSPMRHAPGRSSFGRMGLLR